MSTVDRRARNTVDKVRLIDRVLVLSTAVHQDKRPDIAARAMVFTAGLSGIKTPWGCSGEYDYRQEHYSSHGNSGVVSLRHSTNHYTSDSVHQTGKSYSSNNAGDGPEKTRDRKSWFPRFKSNWLGTFRSKQMFFCCECAVPPTSNGSLSSHVCRYKGAEGKHCRCGKDQWHLAKTVEETEYNRRMEVSKALGGMRYDEAVQRLRSMGQSELDFKPLDAVANVGMTTQARETALLAMSSPPSSSSNPPKRARSVSGGPLLTKMYPLSQGTKPELPYVSSVISHVYGYENVSKHYGVYPSGYHHNNYIEGMQLSEHSEEHEHLTTVPFGDEECIGELLQGILEDDSRFATVSSAGLCLNQINAHGGGRIGYCTGAPATPCPVAPLKRTMSMPAYAVTPMTDAAEQEYYDSNRRASLHHAPAHVIYQQHQPVLHHQFPYQQQLQHQSQQQVYSRPLLVTSSPMAAATSTSFST